MTVTKAMSMPLTVGRLLLPEVKLRASAQSKQMEKRFTYLWQTAHTMAPTSAAVAHQLISSMVAMARQHHLELPNEIMDFVCENCGGLLLPSVTADIRVQPQTHKSAAKRKLSRKRKEAQSTLLSIHNVMRISCRRCEHVTIRMGATAPRKPKSKKRPLDDASAAANAAKRFKSGVATSSSSQSATETSVSNASASVAPLKEQLKKTEPAPAPVVKPPSMFAPPPSPPRKLLDGPKKKKKKKPQQQPDAATVAVKSSLSAFLSKVPSGGRK